MIKHLTIIALLLLSISIMPGKPLMAQEIVISPLKLNSNHHSELAPFVHDSVIYFISNRKHSIFRNIFNQHGEHLYRLYQSPVLNDGQAGVVTPVSAINSQALTVGPAIFTPDGTRVISTLGNERTLRGARIQGVNNRLGLFIVDIRDGQWGIPSRIPLDTGNFSAGHATLSPDGRQLFFVSDMDGGKGQTDIYVSTRNGADWGEPRNLGPIINTPGRELFPFFHPSGKLYFTSDGHPGKGGMDIFYSIQGGNGWGEPTALSAPVNTPHDDFSAFINYNELSGYIASNRDGNDNIYFFEYALEFCANPVEVTEDTFCFTFFEESALETDTAAIQYLWKFSDGHVATGASTDHCFPGPGFYEVSLSVVDTITGHELYSVARYELLLESTRQVYFAVPHPVRQNEAVTFNATLKGVANAGEVEFFWDFGDGKKEKGVTVEHVFRNKGKFRVKSEAYWNGQQLCSYRMITVE